MFELASFSFVNFHTLFSQIQFMCAIVTRTIFDSSKCVIGCGISCDHCVKCRVLAVTTESSSSNSSTTTTTNDATIVIITTTVVVVAVAATIISTVYFLSLWFYVSFAPPLFSLYQIVLFLSRFIAEFSRFVCTGSVRVRMG